MLSIDLKRFVGARGALVLFSTILASSVASAQQTPAPAKPAPKAAAAKPAPVPAAPKAEARPATGEVQPTLIAQYGDWGAYYAAPGGKKICFAIAKPKSAQTNPAGRKRDPVWLFVSDRPAE